MGVCFHKGPAFEKNGGALLSSGLLIERDFMKFLTDMQNSMLTGISLYWGPVGEPGKGSFSGNFEKKVYLGSFLGPRGH
jgi:hypothetical protein